MAKKIGIKQEYQKELESRQIKQTSIFGIKGPGMEWIKLIDSYHCGWFYL